MIGGEGEENPIWMTHGTWIQYAKKFVSIRIVRVLTQSKLINKLRMLYVLCLSTDFMEKVDLQSKFFFILKFSILFQFKI